MTWMDVLTWRGKHHGTGERYGYYRCWKAAYGKGKAGRDCGNMKYHRDEPTEEAAWGAFVETITHPDRLALVFTPPAPERPDHIDRIDALKEQMATAFSRAVTAGIPDDVLTRTLKPLRAELTRLEADMATPPPTVQADLAVLSETWGEALAHLMPEERRETLTVTQARFVLEEGGPCLVSLVLPSD